MFIRLSTTFLVLLGLTAIVSAGVPLPRSPYEPNSGKRDDLARVARSETFTKQPDARAEPTARSETFTKQPDARAEPTAK
ncbi:uncharacterized protein HD556DRAFT_1527564 [Suillus plorans]|uniref:Secreted protein n=1 Tax=Suillus plorans TaxID=116603 RepID=A0A9P7AP87_9AGAM|nr:uncharacterized protein HD556DRAFT_1527564 [Suillus plorans]KAG1793549.1 hypothetical protein HD556DRAFT_1527564 [Suillus plorans]